MMNAKDARTMTETQLDIIAKEFIINNVSKAIHKAIDAGDFSVSVDVMTVKNGRKLAPRVVKMLTDNWGYFAEYKVIDAYRCEERIDISWEE